VPDQFIREKFTRERTAARKFAKEYFERYPKDRTKARHLAGVSASVGTVSPRAALSGWGGREFEPQDWQLDKARP
jgi:hypothetical protein